MRHPMRLRVHTAQAMQVTQLDVSRHPAPVIAHGQRCPAAMTSWNNAMRCLVRPTLNNGAKAMLSPPLP